MILVRMLRALSDGVAWIDRLLLRVLIAAVALFVLANVTSRPFGVTLSWADELAIQSMILAAFVGASLMLRARRDPAVLLLHERMGQRGLRVLRGTVYLVAAGFGAALGWMCWIWLDPRGLAEAGFDVLEFEARTFNFVYTERTPVLGWPFVWFFLVLPWFALTLTVHALRNLAEEAGLLPVTVTVPEAGEA